LLPLLQVGSVTAPEARGGRYFYFARRGDEDQPVAYWREGPHGEPHVLLDPQQLDPSGLTSLEGLAPSPDGRSLAYGSYRAGDESTPMRLIDVDSSEELSTVSANKVQRVEWLPDGSGFVYRNLADPTDPYSGKVAFHRLGEELSRDAVIMRQL